MISNIPCTIPNLLSLFRLLGVPLLFWFVTFESELWFIGWFLILGFTDFLDGYLARKWNQVTDLGSMLDSIADLAYYISAAWLLITLFPDYILPNLGILIVFFVLLVLFIVISKWKTGAVLFLHTHISRLAGVLVFVTMLLSFYADTTLLVRGVILLYTIAIIEFSAIFLIFGRVDLDTRSILWLTKEQKTDTF